ncbi:unnamed protein product [Adineta steineri]|uniref:Uncharacterized protein n=1 Tax=Adineta steineri TaxID=433720 RepID=A0A819VRG4_9BILA|nr:unnamed protein product [Adineta steineri]CAF1319271.1 unnamed protein product [Adineta steineri]CAF1538325.1 unnamed protein product [Adineta steineri]CAF4114137.1 unnamed protein product [Adineta steineri]
MEYQPYDDVPQRTYDDEDYDQFDTKLSFDQSQCLDNKSRNDYDIQMLLFDQVQFEWSNISSRNDLNIYLPPSFQSPDDLLNNEDVTSSSLNGQATVSIMPNNVVVEELCRGQSSEVIHYCPEPVNAMTVTTTTSDEDEDSTETVADTSSESSLDDTEHHAEEASLKKINELIAKLLMTIKTHPLTSIRLRYKSDGRRRANESLANPIVIDISNLTHIELSFNQKFVIRLLLAAWTENPSDKAYLHSNKLGYLSNDARGFSDGTIYIPVTSDDISKGIKALSDLSITKRPLREYNRKLTPLKLLEIASDIRGNGTVTGVHEAKELVKNFNLQASWLVCQLLIKQNEKTFHFTDIICATHKMEETQQSTKRPKEPTKDDEEDEEIDKRPSRSKSKSTKRQKISH